jgi:hypothetical protein
VTGHPQVPHPRDLLAETRGWNARLASWVAEHVLASLAMFDCALLLPLLTLPMSTGVKVTLGVISGSWVQWWALPALQRSAIEADRKRDAKADADHAALTHLATAADATRAALEDVAAMTREISAALAAGKERM